MDAPSTEDAAFLAFAGRLADAAGAAILPHFRTGVEAEAKAGKQPGFDPVTIADRNAEAAMRELIREHYPAHGIVGEEFPETPSQDGYCWVLDPIDGTRAFISGLPLWGVLIALCRGDRPLIGIIDQPFLRERFRGWPGGADFHSPAGMQPLRVRACARLAEATFTTTDPNLFTGGEIGAVEMVRRAARLTRFGYDCYAYAMVAAGFMDLAVESGLSRWDIAALIPVIEGAGGMVTDWRGDPAWRGGQVIAAGDTRVYEEALIALRRAAK